MPRSTKLCTISSSLADAGVEVGELARPSMIAREMNGR